MNTADRRALESAKAKLISIQTQLNEAQMEIVALRDLEQTFFDELPETSQLAEKGVMAEKNISRFEDADLALDDISSSFLDLDQLLNEIK